MADEYDPTAPPTFDAAAVEDHEDSYDPASYGDGGGQQDDANDEDDDYDPSSMNYGEVTAQSTPAQSKPQTPTQAETTAPKSQTKVAGFIVEESDDEQDTSAPPAPSQVNGNIGAHSGLGAVAQSEAQDVSLNSAPHVDTAEASSSLNGFTVPVPASSSTTVAPDITLQQTATPPGQDGKTVSAAASVQPTPQPTQQSIAPTPQPPAQQSSLPSVQAPPARLPHDKVGQLEDRIKDDPKGDIDAWYELINHYTGKEQYDNVRNVYRRFSEVFRTAVCTHSPFQVLFVRAMRQGKLCVEVRECEDLRAWCVMMAVAMYGGIGRTSSPVQWLQDFLRFCVFNNAAADVW